MDRTSEEMYGHKWWLCWKISFQCGRELNSLHSDITVIILHGQILILYNWRAYLSITPRIFTRSLNFTLLQSADVYLFLPRRKSSSGPRPPHYRIFIITLRHITVGRASLDEWSARRRDLYLTTHNIHQRQTSISPAGFEPTIPASERPQTHAIDRAATEIGRCKL